VKNTVVKNWLWIPLAALVGLAAGSWGPRTDLRLMRERMQSDRAVRKASAVSGFDAFARLTGIPDVAKNRDSKPLAQPEAASCATNGVTNVVAEVNASKRMSGREHFRRQMTKEDLRARIDEAAELWRTRVTLATTQWKEKLHLTDEKGSAAFDSAVASMNEALHETMQAMADEIESAGKTTPELALRLMGDASRVMAETYDALGAAVPPESRADVSEVPVFELVDPSVAEPLISVQDKLGGAVPENSRR